MKEVTDEIINQMESVLEDELREICILIKESNNTKLFKGDKDYD